MASACAKQARVKASFRAGARLGELAVLRTIKAFSPGESL